jgi:hypothetical protein
MEVSDCVDPSLFLIDTEWMSFTIITDEAVLWKVARFLWFE